MKLIDHFKKYSALYGANAPYIEGMFEAYLADPNSVSEDWQKYFAEYRQAAGKDVALGPIKESFAHLARQPRGQVAQTGYDHVASEKQSGVLKLISAYRRRGHQVANLCPLHLRERKPVPELALEYHGLSSADLNTEFNTGGLTNVPRMKLSQIISVLENVYTQHVGVEYMHITDHEEINWLKSRLETTGNAIQYSAEEKKATLEQLVAAEGLERYLHMRYVGQKRFSLEGGDALIPMMHELIDRASDKDAEEIVIGMAHRGRLNMLVNILGKAPKDLFDEFDGIPTFHVGSGDVKYHMGFSSTVQTQKDPVHLALSFNPSHLEIVNPVVEGSVRARLERRLDKENSKLPYNKVMPVLIHGDASFAGQGVVMETLQLSEVRGYKCGGTVHLVINNQIGFTTSNPLDVRSATYCTDVAKMIQAPIFHVNGDDPEAVKFVTQIALAYRQTFNKDVVIDLVCYRRLGHNEADEPSATQPMMYKKIKAHKTPARIYADKLIAEGVITEDDFTVATKAYRDKLELGQPVGLPSAPSLNTEYINEWKKILKSQSDFGTENAKQPKTSVDVSLIKRLTETMNVLPEGLTLHPRVQRIHENRYKMGSGALEMDWGYAETMAYATILEEGYPVRLSGQDSGRGTFFHRHAVYHNQNDGSSYVPLSHLSENQAKFTVIDSILSEEAVLGFEYGFATAEPNALVIWEGQFGDFVNGAQVVIDQFIASGETKWRRLNGLVMLLPHGYEGQGPEHSSARPERFLELCAENNMSVVVPTTPAQAFHMFRRQILQDYRKPLVCMSPKSLLRHRQAVSTLDDLTNGEFQPIIPEISNEVNSKKVDKLVISVGKIYYDLYNARAEKEDYTTAIIRLEELYPFPEAKMREIVASYPKVKEVVFCQDEPANQGYAVFVRDYLNAIIGADTLLRFVTRPRAAAPAVGYHTTHVEQQNELIENVFKK